ncbi:type II toxin-antitoxin system RelE/ParE family toxin [Aliarcobacter butzleri]|uniref:type II toxin-antitoxin system RelE/ParE family toxin n=1 Tax=Aliarcobacter butzleri TaxID=28197 RepID=UPI001EDC3489|nr:type II toxin-antitoxin system RelE/ParE family toxin [Aliarcobacter butzleri]MCG3693496.1 type II toxin-antitoxin system RelE/ParE family toxin [Aliarcobacter butzleri]
MILEQSSRFEEEFEISIDFIAFDSVNRVLEFYDEIIFKIRNVPHSPYSYRKRNNSENSTRELIFKGYTIPFEIDEENNKIIILGIFNQNLWN